MHADHMATPTLCAQAQANLQDTVAGGRGRTKQKESSSLGHGSQWILGFQRKISIIHLGCAELTQFLPQHFLPGTFGSLKENPLLEDVWASTIPHFFHSTLYYTYHLATEMHQDILNWLTFHSPFSV